MLKPAIGITMGDAAGIGPEIVSKTASESFFSEMAHPVIIGDERVLKLGMKIAGVQINYTAVSSAEEAVVTPGIVLLRTEGLSADVTVGKKSAEY